MLNTRARLFGKRQILAAATLHARVIRLASPTEAALMGWASVGH